MRLLQLDIVLTQKKATKFRIWATKSFKGVYNKGFVLDDERLKQGKHFGKDYFDELLERMREIRASERRFYQKITDIYALSIDYDKSDAFKNESGSNSFTSMYHKATDKSESCFFHILLVFNT